MVPPSDVTTGTFGLYAPFGGGSDPEASVLDVEPKDPKAEKADPEASVEPEEPKDPSEPVDGNDLPKFILLDAAENKGLLKGVY